MGEKVTRPVNGPHVRHGARSALEILATRGKAARPGAPVVPIRRTGRMRKTPGRPASDAMPRSPPASNPRTAGARPPRRGTAIQAQRSTQSAPMPRQQGCSGVPPSPLPRASAR